MNLSKEEQQLLNYFRSSNVKGKRIILDDAEFCAYKWPKKIIAYEVLAHKMVNKKKS